MEGRDLESICQAAVQRIGECLAEASEVVKSIQLSQNGRRESTKQGLQFKPTNLYGSKWLRHIEDSSDPPKVESPVMRKDNLTEDFAQRFFEEMAGSLQPQQFNQNSETPGCLLGYNPCPISVLRQKGMLKENGNRPKPECDVSTTLCQTPRECQTRSPALLSKSSMKQRSTQHTGFASVWI